MQQVLSIQGLGILGMPAPTTGGDLFPVRCPREETTPLVATAQAQHSYLSLAFLPSVFNL